MVNSQTQQMPDMDDDNNYSGNDSSTYGEEQQELLLKQIDTKSVLDEFEHRVLRGEYQYIDVNTSEKKWKKYDENQVPIINEIGIREVLGRLMGYVNIITKLSWFSEEEIYKNLFYFDMSISELFGKRSSTWGLNIETAKSLKDACLELVQSTLFSARSGFSAISLRTQYSKSEVSRTDSSSSQQKKSFLGIPIR